jgi:hypothetical protein
MRLESCTKTPHELLFIDRLPKVTNDPDVQGASSVTTIGVGSNKNRRNRVTSCDEVFIELEAGHCRHMHVCDQAGGFDEARRREKIGCRRESRDVVAE